MHHTTPRFITFALLGCLTAAPAHRSSAQSVPALRNSAQLSAVEELRIGNTDDPDKGFSWIASIDVADDGTVFVLDSKECHVRVFDASGRLITTFGRRGQGPGEFTSPVAVGALGDSVWVNDAGNRRISFFTRTGKLISSVPLGVASVGTGRLNAWVTGAVPRRNHTFVSVPGTGSFQLDASVDSLRIPRLLFDTTGTVIDTLGWSMQHELKATKAQIGESWAAYRPLQFSSYPKTVDADTMRVIVEQGPVSAAEGRLHITRVDDRGKAIWTRQYSYVPRRVTRDRTEERIAAFAKSSFSKNGALIPGATDAVRAALTFPDYFAAASRVLLGKDGTVWLGRGDQRDDETPRWIVIDASGKVRGDVALPKNAVLPAIHVRGDRVWVPLNDNSGALWIGRFRIANR
jgi:hypothetical protein